MFPSPSCWRRCPAGADEGTREATCSYNDTRASPRTLTPTPLPQERGFTPRTAWKQELGIGLL
ncbi:hypothetical protein FLG15_06800 [Xanthomonas phaseoli pv. dieffenbachiae]